jgi:glycosyltransferase involved in cell wall biosynthesis
LRLKIVHIITGLEVGGAETFLSRLLPELKASHDCEVISLSTFGVIGPRLEAAGISVHALGMVPNRLDIGKYLALVGLLKKLKPDVVHTWLYHSNLLGGLAARQARVPSVMWNIRQTQLSHDYVKLRSLMVARMGAMLSGIVPDVIVCCADAARESHVGMGYERKRIKVIPNGIDVSRFQTNAALRAAARAALEAGPNTLLVGMVGRFERQKNHQGLFEAMSLLRERSNLRLVLAGRNLTADNTQLTGWIEASGLKGKVVLLGLRDDLERFLPGLDVFVSPSKDEGFPNAVAEAMACGLPCAVTEVGDSAFLVGSCGRIVPPNDSVELAKAIAALLDLPESRRWAIGESARARIVAEFGLKRIAQRYAQLYTDQVQ